MTIALAGLIVVSLPTGWFTATRAPTRVRKGRSLWWHPGLWLLVVTMLIYLNQVLFTIYVLRVRHGDATFIARYLPSGWFALATRNPLISWLAAHFPAPALLSVTVLRVQAFLELPFVVFAYLLVCRWCGPQTYRRAVAMVWPVAISYTATFCLVEWSLRNPYTVQDLVIRLVSAAVVPLWVSRFIDHDGRRVGSLADLVLFGTSAATVGYLVLTVYDTALLYNLGHLGGRVPRAALTLALLVTTRLAAARSPERDSGPWIGAFAAAVGWFLVLFWVPALPIRYGLSFGLRAPAAVALVLVALASASAALKERPVHAWRCGLLIVLAGVLGSVVGFAVSAGYPESRLLAAAAGGFILMLAACALCDRLTAHVPASTNAVSGKNPH